MSTKVGSGETAATVTTTIFGKVTGVASDSNGVYVGLGDAVTAGLGDILTIRNDDYFDKGKPGAGEDTNTPGEGDSEESSTLADAAKVLKTAAEAAVGAATLGLL